MRWSLDIYMKLQVENAPISLLPLTVVISYPPSLHRRRLDLHMYMNVYIFSAPISLVFSSLRGRLAVVVVARNRSIAKRITHGEKKGGKKYNRQRRRRR